jgi:hypothetical protein
MPIRRELRSFYPPHWKELSRRVRFERARGPCEACGRPHATLIRCLRMGGGSIPRNGPGAIAAAGGRDGRIC